MSSLTLSQKFTVRYSATCDSNDDCGCIDSCPVNTETAQLTAVEIMQIGLVDDNEWIDSIQDAKGNHFSKQEILAELNLFMIMVNEKSAKDYQNDMNSLIASEKNLTQAAQDEADKETRDNLITRLNNTSKRLGRVRRWRDISEAIGAISPF